MRVIRGMGKVLNMGIILLVVVIAIVDYGKLKAILLLTMGHGTLRNGLKLMGMER